jgi:hypothetical protein
VSTEVHLGLERGFDLVFSFGFDLIKALTFPEVTRAFDEDPALSLWVALGTDWRDPVGVEPYGGRSIKARLKIKRFTLIEPSKTPSLACPGSSAELL